MTNHSPGPWQWLGGTKDLEATGKVIFEFEIGDSLVLERIVACANACKGIPTANLEALSHPLLNTLLDVNSNGIEGFCGESVCPDCGEDYASHAPDCNIGKLLQNIPKMKEL